MSDRSKIEWTEATWNAITGCTKVSPGCDHCYAERIVERFHGKGAFNSVDVDIDKIELPLHGFGQDPYLIQVVSTDVERRTNFRNEIR